MITREEKIQMYEEQASETLINMLEFYAGNNKDGRYDESIIIIKLELLKRIK